ncbi:serine-rich adhesin for platelets-like [Haliotis cracherodii]|uniref:serine-rich adhesin for platelets-like n=1 Tax=Haliotis cracherodii TaxID=6455 RepID=UPI0039E9D35F
MFVIRHDQFGGGSVMVWGGITAAGRTDLHVVAGRVTDQYYRDNILAAHVVPFARRHGRRFIFQDDNASFHRARIVTDYLQQQHITTLPWPALSPDLSPIEHPEVMSGVEETKDGGGAEKMARRELLYDGQEIHKQFEEELEKQLEEELEAKNHAVHRVILADFERFRKLRKREEREVQSAAEQIKTETQELQQDTTSQSDPKVTHTARFIQTMSEEMLKQKERLSDNNMSAKETCREVKIVVQQVTDLVKDKLQPLSEDAKLKLESLIKNFRKMTASMWKLMFCALLLYKLREVLDSLKSDSYNISLSSGRLKYAFKMASMLALWLSHDVESNPGPEFNHRTCFEMLVRRFSESLREDLEIGGTIWSDKVAKAAYNAGFSNKFRWKNPSGKNKDSLPDLIERAEELGRVLTERNCLPRDLAPFAVNLDHQETQDRLRQHFKTENYRNAVFALISEPDFTSSNTEEIRHLTQWLQDKMSDNTSQDTARSPPLTTTHSEFSQLADSQSVTNSIISKIDTPYQSKRSQRKKNKNPKTKQISNVTASEMCIATGIPCHDMLTGGTMVEGVETDSTPGRLSNSHCTLSTSTPDTTDMSHQDQNIMEAETTWNSDFVRMTLENIRENEMKSTPGTSGTDSSHASVAEHAKISDSNSFDETNVNNNSEVPSQEGQRNVDLLPPSPRNSCDVNDGVEMPFDILGHISLTSDTSDETFYADLSSGLYNFMQGDDINTPVTDADTEMNDVPLLTDTDDCALPANIGIDPFSVMTGDNSNTSSSDASNPENSPYDVPQQDAADEGCEDEVAQTSQPSHEAVVPTENNQLDQPNTATDRCQDQNKDASREERTERHESQSVAGLGANRRNIKSTDTETDNEMRVITPGTDTEMRVITPGTSTHVSEIESQADERKSAEENEYITKSGLQENLQELEATLNTLNQQVHLGESDTSLGSISASGGVTEEAGGRKRKRQQQHPPTKKKRQ